VHVAERDALAAREQEAARLWCSSGFTVPVSSSGWISCSVHCVRSTSPASESSSAADSFASAST
jgi:hypothetical protein